MAEIPSWEKLPAEYSTAIGQLALGAGEIDVLLTDVASAIMEVDVFRAIAVFHHQQPSSKVSSLKALCGLVFREDDGSPMERQAEITDIIGRAGAEMEYRNSIIHAYWTVDDDGLPHAVRFSARGKVERKRRPVEIAEIRAHVLVIRELLAELRALRTHLRYVFVKGKGASLPSSSSS